MFHPHRVLEPFLVALTEYVRVKNVKSWKEAGGQSSIHKYETLEQLQTALEGSNQYMSSGERKKLSRFGTEFDGVEEVEITDANYMVFRITTEAAIHKVAEHTDWCVRDSSHSGSYLRAGPLYLIMHSPADPKPTAWTLASNAEEWTPDYFALASPARKEILNPQDSYLDMDEIESLFEVFTDMGW